MEISLLLPTRKRVNNIKRLVDSVFLTADNPNQIEFIFYIDKDDGESKNYLTNIYNSTTIIGDRILMSNMWNKCYSVANSNIFMHCGDDIIFRTKGWDSSILKTFEKYDDKIIFVHGNDCIQGNRLGTHGFLHRNWVKTIGYFTPPYFSADYNDTWLTDVSNIINRRIYLPEIFTEHMHFIAGKSNLDETYRETLGRGQKDNVGQLYESLINKRIADANKLQEFIKNYK